MKKSDKYTNKLIDQTSPYLLQHANNPVNWYPWGEEALAKAQKEDKLILISVGYSACHWCHVMAHESFENEKIAKIMNKLFVCIKVDREERPDVDKVYMEAVHLMRGQGGWPLNCFALPDGRPVYGGTYFRTEQWTQILESLAEGYKREPEKYTHAAEQITKGIANFDNIDVQVEDNQQIKINFEDAVNAWKNYFDPEYGSENGSPKFPMPSGYRFLLKYFYHTKDKIVQNHVMKTLYSMARGGIYDQLAGGFARYSTDKKWLVPHFEKMLYDNAQLVSLYSEAYLLTKNPFYKTIVDETLRFLQTEMQSPEGGFYAAIDADSEGVEGKFYVWDASEITKALGQDSELFNTLYNVSEFGNWEGKNILHTTPESEKLVEKIEQDSQKRISKINQAKQKLLEHRNKRIRPGMDDKILTSWNALAVSAFAHAYASFGNPEHLKQAHKTADFLIDNIMAESGQLMRTFKNGIANINAFADDYALLTAALINLYEQDFNEKYLFIAKKINDYFMQHFWDAETGYFFYTSDEDPLIVSRKREISDNVIPSANSVAAHNLYKLGILFHENNYIETARKMTAKLQNKIESNIVYYSNWASSALNFEYQAFEIAVCGAYALNIKSEINAGYRPDLIFSGCDEESELPFLENRFIPEKLHIYICKAGTCLYPVTDVNSAKGLTKSKLINDTK